MTIGAPVSFPVSALDDLVPCFDATAADVFAASCHLVDGDRDAAETLLIDVYLALRGAVEAGATVVVDHEWIVATALRQVLGQQPDGANAALTARERAVIELHLIDGSDIESVAEVLGLTPDEVSSSLARYDRSVSEEMFSSVLVDDLLRRCELWLDDATRRRARAALRHGRRPTHGDAPAPDHPLTATATAITTATMGLTMGLTESPSDRERSRRPIRPGGPFDGSHRRRSILTGTILAGAVLAAAIGIAALAALPDGSSTPADDRRTSGSTLDSTSGSTLDSTSAATSDSAGAAGSGTDLMPNSTTAPGDSAVAPTNTGSTGPADGIIVSSGSVVVTGHESRAPSAPPGFVLDSPPTGFVANGSSELVDPPIAGRFQVWAEPDATRSDGRWLAVTTMRSAFSRTAIIPDGVRETIGSSPAVMSFDVDDIPVLTVQPLDAGQFSITGGGFSADELRQLAAGITLADGVATFDPALDALRADLPLLLDTTSEFAPMTAQILNGDRRISTYVSPDTDEYVELVTQPTSPDDLRISELILPPSSDSLAASSLKRTLQMGPLQLSVSSAPDNGLRTGGRSSVRWHIGTDTITLSGNAGLYQLLGAVADVRPATTDEWTELYGMDRVELGAPPLADESDLIQIGRTTTEDNSRWTISVSPDPLVVRLSVRNYSVAGIMGEFPLALDSLHSVHEFVSMSSTSVVVALTITEPGDATGVRIAVGGAPPTTLPLVPLSGTDVFVAGLTFRDANPYTVALVDDAGGVVRSLTP